MFGFLCSALCSLPPFRGKQRVLKSLFSHAGFYAARSWYGVPMVQNVCDSTWRASMVGSYGTFISDHIAGIDEDFVFLDIGSNQGVFGLLSAMNPRCRKVVCLEPNPFTFGRLALNVELLDSPVEFSIHNVALCSGEQDFVPMTVPIGHSGASSMAAAIEGRSKSFDARAMAGATLRNRIGKLAGLGVHAKIDVEGAEMIVLKELRDSGLLQEMSSIVIEVSEKVRGGSRDEISAFFDEAGWSMAKRSGQASHFDAVFVSNSVNAVPSAA